MIFKILMKIDFFFFLHFKYFPAISAVLKSSTKVMSLYSLPKISELHIWSNLRVIARIIYKIWFVVVLVKQVLQKEI